jgi:D-alanyl-D-alanine carboxypeptidase (penicillin-binding protein 5/6)
MHGIRLLPLGAGSAILLVIAAVIANGFIRPLPRATAVQTFSVSTGAAPAMPWPSKGQAALGVQGLGVVASTPTPRPQPIASVVKVMTALITLEAKPLAPGQQGPDITVVDADVQAYDAAAANGESVVPVVSGETLTEYQALQGLLVAAGDNVAELLARWVAGSEAAFVQQMNARAVRLGLHRTSFADASGISPASVSVPEDLVRLGQAAMANPVLAQIAGQPQAVIPLMGPVPNFNKVLGQDGIVGLKTGYLPGAGADFLFAGVEPVAGGPPLLVVGALQGLATQDDTFASATALLDAARTAIHTTTVVARGQHVGRARTSWGGGATLIASKAVTAPVWPGSKVTAHLSMPPRPAPIAAGARVGTLTLNTGDTPVQVPVATAAAVGGPDVPWRLLRGV